MSNPLRNPNIDYERGWFSVTVQVAHNKSVFGAIVGEECKLNALGLAVHEAWLAHPAHTPGLFIDEFRYPCVVNTQAIQYTTTKPMYAPEQALNCTLKADLGDGLDKYHELWQQIRFN